VWNVDEADDKSKATLGARDMEQDAVNALLKIAPGFPKLLDNKDRAGLPAGKKQLVLGFCPNLQAKQLLEVLDTALPGADWYRVDGRGVSPSCPTPDKEGEISDKGRKRVGKLELSALVLEPKAGVEVETLHGLVVRREGVFIGKNRLSETRDGQPMAPTPMGDSDDETSADLTEPADEPSTDDEAEYIDQDDEDALEDA